MGDWTARRDPMDPIDVMARYEDRTARSRELYGRARRSIAGGTTRSSVWFEPYPLYAASGEGCRIVDADGVERIDCIGNYSALVLGHRHPAVLAAIAAQLERGTAFSAPSEREVELAELLCERLASVERVRFTSTGTEATMYAMRVARAATGRTVVARFEGGYHGTHDFAQVSTHPDLAAAGDPRRPSAVADGPGIPPRVLEMTLVLPFNDLEGAKVLLAERAADVAAVIVEPVMGSCGCIPAEEGFLEGLREITRELGMLLIFDEVISLRLGYGGAQGVYSIEPDLTTMGKIIGGGLPVAAFGGSADLMGIVDPEAPVTMEQAGTYNGNPLGTAAGAATMRELTPTAVERLNAAGETLRTELREVFAAHELDVQIVGMGSILAVHFTNGPVRNYRDVAGADGELLGRFVIGMMNEGIFLAPRGMMALCTPMTDGDLAQVVRATDRVAAELA
jgi:glutamate-1-semialdehyde 2,1-aminomutase